VAEARGDAAVRSHAAASSTATARSGAAADGMRKARHAGGGGIPPPELIGGAGPGAGWGRPWRRGHGQGQEPPGHAKGEELQGLLAGGEAGSDDCLPGGPGSPVSGRGSQPRPPRVGPVGGFRAPSGAGRVGACNSPRPASRQRNRPEDRPCRVESRFPPCPCSRCGAHRSCTAPVEVSRPACKAPPRGNPGRPRRYTAVGRRSHRSRSASRARARLSQLTTPSLTFSVRSVAELSYVPLNLAQAPLPEGTR